MSPSRESSALRLPDFIGVGPPRTATTWLHQALKGHVGLPIVKETNFFLSQYHRGLEWYASLFSNCSAGSPLGEFSPRYFVDADVRERIAANLPDCRIIVSLRDPVERLYSHYRKGYQEGYFRGTFEGCLQGRPDLLDWSHYAGHVRAWCDALGRENVLVLIHDELKNNPQEFLNRVTRFIGIKVISVAEVPSAFDLVNAIAEMPRSQHLALLARSIRDRLEERGRFRLIRMLAGMRPLLFGGGPKFPRLRPDTEARLRGEFEPDIQELERLLGYELPQWRASRVTAV